MIYGINPSSLIDYPGEICFVIFLGGCNFKCPFCHNKDIVKRHSDIYDRETVFKMLRERKDFINAVTITGGEPTIHGEKLIELIKEIKELGFKVKLDTNGTKPEILKKLIDKKLIDYIAMDIKNTFDKYDETTGINVDIDKIKESIILIEKSNIGYEFRTTVNKEMHTETAIFEIISYIKDNSKLFLQPYRYSTNQLKDVHYTPYFEDELEKFKDIYKVSIR
jgi:pyruvate formate lyase activating enzyme